MKFDPASGGGTCPGCGANCAAGGRFCRECGTALSAATPSKEAARKQVTVLFTDLTGFTAMSDRLDPEDMQEITGEIFSAVTEVVTRYEGSIESFAGDGALVLFGVPRSHEDDPVRAVRSAMEIHERVAAISPRHEPKVGRPLSMHSGIDTGLAVIGNSDPLAGTHGVVGDVVNIASRLSGEATSGEILIGVDTWGRSEGQFEFETLTPVSVKGKSEPIEVFKVLAAKRTPIKTHGRSGLNADLVGRDRELEQLFGAVERVRGGQRSVITVCGEAGTGKSRLVGELKAGLDLNAIQWREGHAYGYTQNRPFSVVIDLLNRALRIEEGDAAEVIRHKVESSLVQLLGGNRELIPYIGNLFALTYPDTEQMSPEFWKARLFEGLAQTVEGLSRRGPTVICFEDIHWADPSSLELLRYLLDHVEAPCLFLCVYRLPFEFAAPKQVELRLEKLSAADTQQMLASLLEVDFPNELREFIEDKAEGNPFYLEEVVNGLIQSGALERENGAWRMTRGLAESDTPPTVQGLISSRVDRLDAEMKRILQEASVIGRVFLREILKKITDIRSPVDDFLVGLEKLDMVKLRALEPDLEYIFKHALTQEVVYNGLLKKDRREIHERIALAMERMLGDRLPEFYETLAFHFVRGRSQVKAVDYLMRSGAKSLRRFALDESHRYYEDAYDILTQRTGRGTEEDARLIDLLVEWTRVFYYQGDFKKLGNLLAANRDVAVSLDDKLRLSRFYIALSVPIGWQVNWREAYDIIRDALDLSEQVGDPSTEGHACMWLTWICADQGSFDEAMGYGERAVEICATKVDDRWLKSKSLSGLATVYLYQGNLQKARELANETLELGAAHGDSRTVVIAETIFAQADSFYGDLPASLRAAKRGIEAAADPLYSELARSVLAASEVQVGNFEDARDLAGGVLEFTARHGALMLAAPATLTFGASTVGQGHVAEGMAKLEQARQSCVKHGRRYFECRAEVVLGTVYVQIATRKRGGLLKALKHPGVVIQHVLPAAKKAEAHLRRAITLGEEIGARGAWGMASFELGRLCRATRRPDRAREYLSIAAEQFEICGASLRLEQTRTELARLESDKP